MRARLGSAPAHDAAPKRVLGRILDDLHTYDHAARPLAAWVDHVVDRYVA